MIGKNLQVAPTLKGVFVSLELVNKSDGLILGQLQECELLDVKIGKHRESRSKTQNSYMWQLCNELAIKLQITKEEVYRLAIGHVGVFQDIMCLPKVTEGLRRHHDSQGVGNFSEIRRQVEPEGEMLDVVRLYYGSSGYNSAEMSRLIQHIVEECKTQGIETMPISEIERLTI